MQVVQEIPMPTTVVLPDALTKKMQSVAIPLQDTYVTVIDRAVDALIEKMKSGTPSTPPSATQSTGGTVPYPADAPPSLTFTKPIMANLDGDPVSKQELYWNLLLFKAIGLAASKLKGPQLRQALMVNCRDGKDESSGFRYIPEAGLSVQGADANTAWKATIHLIKAARMNIDVTFRWDTKEGAAHPGQVGRMVYEAV